MKLYEKMNWTMVWVSIVMFSLRFQIFSIALLGVFMMLYNAGYIGEFVKWLNKKVKKL